MVWTYSSICFVINEALKVSKLRGVQRLQNLTFKLKRYQGCEGCKGWKSCKIWLSNFKDIKVARVAKAAKSDTLALTPFRLWGVGGSCWISQKGFNYLWIQDSSGSAGTDDPTSHTGGSPHNENYLRQNRPQTVFTHRSQCEFSHCSSFGLFTWYKDGFYMHQFMHMESDAWAQSCSWIKCSFEYVIKALIQCWINGLAAELMISNVQCKVWFTLVFVILTWVWRASWTWRRCFFEISSYVLEVQVIRNI